MARERYVINEERAEWVVKTLIEAWRNELPPFDHAEPVPGRLPENLEPGSADHVRFLFQGLPWMRGRIDSAQSFKRLARVHEKHPWMFDQKVLAQIEDIEDGKGRQILEILLENGLGFGVRAAVSFWIANARKLERFWGGNPRNLFWGIKDYDHLCRRFMKGRKKPDSPTGFMGFRHKMVSMLIYFLARAKIIDFKYMFAGPFDIHNSRILTATESIVAVEGMGPGTIIDFYGISPVGRLLYFKYCNTPDDVLDFADALWYLSRDFCDKNLGNMSVDRREPKPVVWNESTMAQYDRTCGICAIESVCKWSLPTGPHYVRRAGESYERLSIRGPRPKPHALQETLVQIDRVISKRPKPPARAETVAPTPAHQLQLLQ